MKPTNEEIDNLKNGSKDIFQLLEERYSKESIKYLFKTEAELLKSKKRFCRLLYGTLIEGYRHHTQEAKKMSLRKAQMRDDARLLFK